MLVVGEDVRVGSDKVFHHGHPSPEIHSRVMI